MASFTSVGDSLELFVPDAGESIAVSLSGTYNMTILFQREVGSKGSGTWETITTYSTANATVADTYTTSGFDENLRFYVSVDTSGTATATLTEGNKDVGFLKDQVGNNLVIYRDQGVEFTGSFQAGDPVVLTGDTTLTAAEHAGRTIVFNTAAGDTVTLPAATGSGAVYKFYCAVTVTSNNNIIQAASASDSMSGGLHVAQDAADTSIYFECAATSDTITMNGTTKGGLLGDFIEIEDVVSGKFNVRGTMAATGTEVTPFSAAV